ncbi:MAG: hypothetical protein MdMp014T_1244 [Treponematales bacterium]
MKPNFESVWKTLQETAETHKETEKIVKENALGMAELREAQKELAESHRETEEVVKETARQLQDLKTRMDGLGLNIGHAAEEFFQTALAKNMNFAGVQFDEMLSNLGKTRGGKSCEFDIVLVNHDAVALIEAKHRVHMSFPEEMATKKAAEFRFFFPEYKGCKLYLGAAGFSVDKRAVEEARRLGVGLLKQDGDAVKAVDISLKAY